MDALNSWGVGWNDPFMGSTAYGTQEARYDATLPSASIGGTNAVPSFGPLPNGFNAPPSVGMGQASASPQPLSQPSTQPPTLSSSQPQPQQTASAPSQQQSWNSPQFWDNFSSWAQQQPWDQPSTWNNFGSTMSNLFNATGQQNPNTNFQNGYLQQNQNSSTQQGALSQMQNYTGP